MKKKRWLDQTQEYAKGRIAITDKQQLQAWKTLKVYDARQRKQHAKDDGRVGWMMNDGADWQWSKDLT